AAVLWCRPSRSARVQNHHALGSVPMQFIPTRVHAMADYAIGLLLIAAPWLLGFANGGAAMWVPIILGCGVILYSLMTAYELGAVPLISMPAHLGLDVAGGLLLAASPWI